MTYLQQHQFDVLDMECAACVASIERAVHRLDATATISASVTTKRVIIGSSAAEADIKAALEDAGYDVKTVA